MLFMIHVAHEVFKVYYSCTVVRKESISHFDFKTLSRNHSSEFLVREQKLENLEKNAHIKAQERTNSSTYM